MAMRNGSNSRLRAKAMYHQLYHQASLSTTVKPKWSFVRCVRPSCCLSCDSTQVFIFITSVTAVHKLFINSRVFINVCLCLFMFSQFLNTYHCHWAPLLMNMFLNLVPSTPWEDF